MAWHPIRDLSVSHNIMETGISSGRLSQYRLVAREVYAVISVACTHELHCLERREFILDSLTLCDRLAVFTSLKYAFLCMVLIILSKTST